MQPPPPPPGPPPPSVMQQQQQQQQQRTATTFDHPLQVHHPLPPPPPPPPAAHTTTTTASAIAATFAQPPPSHQPSFLQSPSSGAQRKDAPRPSNATVSYAAPNTGAGHYQGGGGGGEDSDYPYQTYRPQQSSSSSSSVAGVSTASSNFGGAAAAPKPMSSGTPSASKSLDDLADAFLAQTDGSDVQQPLTMAVLRPPPLPPHCTEMERLRILVSRRAWGDVISVTNTLLRGSSSHYAPIYTALLNYNPDAPPQAVSAMAMTLESHQADVVEIMALQCQAWIKMRRYADLRQEIDRWPFCQNHVSLAVLSPAASSSFVSPKWVPWSLHILAASALQFPALQQQQQQQNSADAVAAATARAALESVDALTALAAIIPETAVEARIQVHHALSNLFTKQKEWRMALDSMQRILDMLPHATKQEASKIVTAATRAGRSAPNQQDIITWLLTCYNCELLSRQGRVLLQVGALKEASQVFERASTTWADLNASGATANELDVSLKDHPAILHAPAQLNVNEGLLCFAYGKYEDALEFFRKAVQMLRKIMTTHKSNQNDVAFYNVEDWLGSSISSTTTIQGNQQHIATAIGIESFHTLYSEVMNNMSICALYTCRLHEAVSVMESLVRQDPGLYLTERVAFNLCTLYELGSDSAVSARKKRTLQLIAKRFFLHDIGPESFRVG